MKITLCGSTKFMDTWREANLKLTLQGHVVYSIVISVKGNFKPTKAEKETLDMVHFKKIDNSDAIVVLDVDHYIGYSTRREIKWAALGNKKIYYLTDMRRPWDLDLTDMQGETE